MTENGDGKSMRNLLGAFLLDNKLAFGVLLFLVASITTFNIVGPILGVPVSLLLIWLITWLMRGTWSDLGVRRPKHIGKVIAIGVSVGILSEVFTILVLIPLLQKTGIEPLDYSNFANMKGNVGMFLMYLMVSWTTAGFGEEVINRGFLMGHLGRLFGGERISWIFSLVLVSLTFGLGHAYQGPMGILLVTFWALAYGLLYIASGFNLWYTIIAHGTADTFVFLLFFTGLADRFI
jgi:membrane protease YdiL (CAAX protease family)